MEQVKKQRGRPAKYLTYNDIQQARKEAMKKYFEKLGPEKTKELKQQIYERFRENKGITRRNKHYNSDEERKEANRIRNQKYNTTEYHKKYYNKNNERRREKRRLEREKKILQIEKKEDYIMIGADSE